MIRLRIVSWVRRTLLIYKGFCGLIGINTPFCTNFLYLVPERTVHAYIQLLGYALYSMGPPENYIPDEFVFIMIIPGAFSDQLDQTPWDQRFIISLLFDILCTYRVVQPFFGATLMARSISVTSSCTQVAVMILNIWQNPKYVQNTMYSTVALACYMSRATLPW